ncbi:SDR family oxidoreductase [Marivibrio halodurans]|uniref:SDR family oxidoreductase n=1 Tax=Marivibrio halodurans TaxID=2039722 RepID=A0A8J7SPW3_9PROT|nr:SDR family oxidoreductase [Marivibrio halodurans]MBP5858606.1 SDR family oxidoreductase [Marivibrio halodurans]
MSSPYAVSFEGHAALIAGGGGGMGLAIANALIAAGAHVAILDLKPRPDDLAAGPGRALHRQGDASDETVVRAVVEEAEGTFGRLDHLVNTTGVLWFDRDKSCLEMDMDVWDQVLRINLKSFALTARHAAPAMKRAGGGSMVHIASVDAMRGDDRPQDAYGASKAAVVRLSKSLAIQLAKDGIRSNCILPGAIMTPMQARWDGDADTQAAVAGAVPLGRIGRADDVASAALFLLSAESGYITGIDLPVDGGVLAAP